VAGAEATTFRYAAAASGGADIDLRIGHPDQPTLRSIASELAGSLQGYAGVRDVDDGFTPGKEQLELRLNEHGRALGLTERDLAGQVRGAFYGAEAARQQRGRDELRIYARLPERQRRAAPDVRGLILRTPRGGEMPLSEAAEMSRGTAPTTIERVGGERITHLTANVYGEANANDVVADLRANAAAELLREHPEMTVSASGRQEDQQESLGALASGFGIALFVIFALLAVTFRDYLQPLVVMGAIPFGIIGAVVGHLMLDYDLSLPSIFGLVALAGVMVNDSLLLVVTANELREEEGLSAREAVIRAGKRRFRPILLTSLTTFLGLAPMIFETSVQARFLIPMALSLGFGLLFATLIIVLLVPALYLANEDIERLGRRALDRLFGTRKDEGEPTPAE
jgi:multidrug efflux pump subunit AcrB